MFSVGLLYSVKDFLKLCTGANMTPDQFTSYFSSYAWSKSEKIITVTFKCAWVRLTQSGFIQLTDRGKEISDLEYKQALLLQLEDLIKNYDPPWGALLYKGRTEVKNFLPQDVCQCFSECGLFETLTEGIIEFWDNLALSYRSSSNKRLLEIGRSGEKLSYQHEFERTGIKPIWQAVESNLSGYDLLSVVDNGNGQKLKIEVKAASGNLNYSKIHITKNEWETAQASTNYLFHLWHLTESPTLYKVAVNIINEHIPSDNGKGNWESVEIPFSMLIHSE